MSPHSDIAFETRREAEWKSAHERIDQAGYGELVADAYRRWGPEIAKAAGHEAALRLGRAVSELAIRTDRRTASLLPEVALATSKLVSGYDLFVAWLEVIEAAAKSAPKSLASLLENNAIILAAIDLDGFKAFVMMGIAIGRRNPERQLAFFRIEDPEARRFFDREEGADRFVTLQGKLRLFLSAVWGLRPPVQVATPEMPEHMRRRPGFGGGGIRMPPAFSGFTVEEAQGLYKAAFAHVGAHLRFTHEPFPVGSLKPLHLATIAVVEDARVERLAMRTMPGLRGLWTPFHVAKPGGPPLATTLLARLARALNDPDYEDPDGWVEKGRSLFESAAVNDLTDQSLSRTIGGLLANDLGQMRLQFDAKSYVVQPAYRDDNIGLWDFGDAAEPSLEMQDVVEGARVEQQERDDGRPDDPNLDGKTDESVTRMSVSLASSENVLVARYPEYDYVARRDRPEWCSVREYQVPVRSADSIVRVEEARSDISQKLANMIRAARTGRTERLRHQVEGEVLDMDACIEATISSRMNVAPDFRVYSRYERRSRDLSVLILLDVSNSTSNVVQGSGRSVLDIERISTALLSHTISGLGDSFALAAFCSDTREDVRYFRVKDFDEPYGLDSKMRLAGLESGMSTRVGPAIRHAAEDLARQRSFRRLLLVITDGEPCDIDVDDERYLVEDARAAVHSLNRRGIDTFCVTLGSAAPSYADRIFGRGGTTTVTSVEQLPRHLPAIFHRLTR